MSERFQRKKQDLCEVGFQRSHHHEWRLPFPISMPASRAGENLNPAVCAKEQRHRSEEKQATSGSVVLNVVENEVPNRNPDVPAIGEMDFGLGGLGREGADAGAELVELYLKALLKHGFGIRGEFVHAAKRHLGARMTEADTIPLLVLAEWLAQFGGMEPQHVRSTEASHRSGPIESADRDDEG